MKVKKKDLEYVLAKEVQPGMITLDGVVMEVRDSGNSICIEHQSIVYIEKSDNKVMIFGELSGELLEHLDIPHHRARIPQTGTIDPMRIAPPS